MQCLKHKKHLEHLADFAWARFAKFKLCCNAPGRLGEERGIAKWDCLLLVEGGLAVHGADGITDK